MKKNFMANNHTFIEQISYNTNRNLQKNIFKNGTPLTLEPSQPSPIHLLKEEIEKGLDFIINHFDPTVLYFPRTIMTKKLGYQKEVFSKEEALQYFNQSDFTDCRINSYRYSSSYNTRYEYSPDFIFIDLDKNNFKTERSFELALSRTLKNIKEKLNGYPTILYTGGGYHIYQPVYCPTALENITEFNGFDRPSEQFLRFAKDNMSNGKADKNNNPSFKSCLLRIPGSINSKYNKKVKIVQKWNKVRPSIPREFIEVFRTYLIQKKIDEYRYRQKIKVKRYTHNNNTIFWIEQLLKTSIADFRKNALSLILAPYLINIKKLSFQESHNILNEWLNRCNSIRKLDFNSNDQVKSALNTANKKRIPPMKLETLKNRNLEIYNKFNR